MANSWLSRKPMPNPEHERKLFLALQAYAEGYPVLIFSDEGVLLHGEETCRAIVDTGVSIDAKDVEDIPKVEFEATDWPDMLEAARRMFMEGASLDPEYEAWVKQNAA